MKSLRKIVFSIFLTLPAVVQASLLRVPSEYATIHNAISLALNGDTVLLEAGIFTDTVSIPVDLTFASGYMLSNDTATIDSTVWRTVYSRTMILPNDHALSFIGIRFESAEPPVSNGYLIYGYVSTFKFEHCSFVGTFDAAPPGSGANLCTIQIPLRSFGNDITLSNCRFYGSPTNIKGWISYEGAGKVIITGCSSAGRSTNAEFLLDINAYDSVKVQNCLFHNIGCGIQVYSSIYSHIDSCRFTGLTDVPLETGSGNYSTTVSNCVFDSCRYTGDNAYYTVSILSQPGITNTIRNSIFTNNFSNSPVSQNQPHDILIGLQDGIAQIINCVIANNVFTGPSLYQSGTMRINGGSLDSCRIYDNRFSNFIAATQLIGQPLVQRFNVTNSDFDRDTFSMFASSYDSVFAQECWWGNPTGPFYPDNPNGQGIAVSGNVYPAPWRSNPVFVNTSIKESSDLPIQNALSAYPNPFNNTVIIHSQLDKNHTNQLFVFDAIGRKVTTLNSSHTNGVGKWFWRPDHCASGCYFIAQMDNFHIYQSIQVEYVK